MIHEKYFDDSFILHDASERQIVYINKIINYINEQNSLADENCEKLETLKVFNDSRQALKNKWASIKRIFFPQPMWDIR
jgi:hypothetical protein